MSRIPHASSQKLVQRWKNYGKKREKGPVVRIVDPTPQAQNVHASTKSASELQDWDQPVRITPRMELVAKAQAEADRVDAFIDASDKSGDNESHGLIQHLMYVVESFEADGVFDEAEFKRFLEMRKVRTHGNAKVPLWQPLVKAFRTSLTKSGVAHKRTRVIAALRHRGIKAKDVLTELAVEERIGPRGSKERGMERFLWVFKKECVRPKPPKEDEIEEEDAEIGSPLLPDSNPEMGHHELIERVRALLSEFVQRSLFTKEVEALLKAFENVDGQAPVVSEASASGNYPRPDTASASEASSGRHRPVGIRMEQRAR